MYIKKLININITRQIFLPWGIFLKIYIYNHKHLNYIKYLLLVYFIFSNSIFVIKVLFRIFFMNYIYLIYQF